MVNAGFLLMVSLRMNFHVFSKVQNWFKRYSLGLTGLLVSAIENREGA
jgi:hypothetical protein